ncbi:MAG: hypothetical protein QY322_01990 [bacterium]|nr:MAG: hypothetical protein QY322_01990 [bacterium]
MQNILSYISNISWSQGHIKAGLIIVLVFLAVVVFGYIRKIFVKSSIDGVFLGIFFGFLLTLLLEGFLLIAGRTAITEILGWKNAPKPITAALDIGRGKLVDVLGVTDEIPSSYASNPTTDDALNVLQSLNPDEMKKIKAIICTP